MNIGTFQCSLRVRGTLDSCILVQAMEGQDKLLQKRSDDLSVDELLYLADKLTYVKGMYRVERCCSIIKIYFYFCGHLRSLIHSRCHKGS